MEIEAKINKARERIEQKKLQKKDAVRQTKYNPHKNQNDDLSGIGFNDEEEKGNISQFSNRLPPKKPPLKSAV